MSRVAVVTGANRGLWFALAQKIADRRFGLGLCGTTLPSTPGGFCRVVDVADAAAVAAFAAAVHADLGPIDVWINNAGVLGPIGPLESADPAAWSRAVAVNLNGTFNGSRAFLSH